MSTVLERLQSLIDSEPAAIESLKTIKKRAFINRIMKIRKNGKVEISLKKAKDMVKIYIEEES